MAKRQTDGQAPVNQLQTSHASLAEASTDASVLQSSEEATLTRSRLVFLDSSQAPLLGSLLDSFDLHSFEALSPNRE